MRTHEQIIDQAGGYTAIGRAVGVDPNTTKQWKRLGRIPAPYWASLARQEIASLEELAEGAERQRSAGKKRKTRTRVAA